MGNQDKGESGPDFRAGVKLEQIAGDGVIAGHVGGTPAMLVRRNGKLFAVGARCSHYGGPLAEGLIDGETVRCPWHHACFDLRTGARLRAPALDPIPCWRVETVDGMVHAREQLAPEGPRKLSLERGPGSVVIIGGGVAGNAAAEALRREGYAGPVTMLSADTALPCDRPNLSKDYLAGKAPEEWTQLRPASFYEEQEIEVRLETRVVAIEPKSRKVRLADGSELGYGALLLAMGAEPVKLDIAGAELPNVRYLRSVDDSRALLARAREARSAVVIGAGFIGLEAAASLRAHELEVHVVGPESIPMEKLLGAELGTHVRRVHERNGVQFHLGHIVSAIEKNAVLLDDGRRIGADIVLVGIGVRPLTALAERAGISVERGIIVDSFLKTSVDGIFAAGDIARWPDPQGGKSVRIEHFVVAERQGETAARNMLGFEERFEDVPFFWTEQHDLSIAYVGHAENWDEAQVEGSIEQQDCRISYRRDGRELAVAVVGRDLEGLHAELAFERRLGLPATTRQMLEPTV